MATGILNLCMVYNGEVVGLGWESGRGESLGWEGGFAFSALEIPQACFWAMCGVIKYVDGRGKCQLSSYWS